MRREDGVENEAAVLADPISMGVGQFVNEAVCMLIALAQQAFLRAACLEAGLFTACLNEVLDARDRPMVTMDPDLVGDIEVTRAQNGNFPLSEGFRRSVGKSNAWSLLLPRRSATGCPLGHGRWRSSTDCRPCGKKYQTNPSSHSPNKPSPPARLTKRTKILPKSHKMQGLPTPRPPNRSRIPSASRMSLKTAKPLICVTPNPEPPLADG